MGQPLTPEQAAKRKQTNIYVFLSLLLFCGLPILPIYLWRKGKLSAPVGIGLAVAWLVVVVAIAASSPDRTPVGDSPSKEAPSAAPAQPKTPEGKLRAALEDTDRDVEGVKIAEYSTMDDGTSKHVTVNFKVGDNLSSKTIRTGIGLDVFAMAQAALKSGVPFEEIAFRGMFPLTDKYGNTTPGQVFFTTFDRTTLKKINFDNPVATSFDNIKHLAIDGIVVLHPDFRE